MKGSNLMDVVLKAIKGKITSWQKIRISHRCVPHQGKKECARRRRQAERNMEVLK